MPHREPPLIAPSYNHTSDERAECGVVGALCFLAGLVTFGIVLLLARWN